MSRLRATAAQFDIVMQATREATQRVLIEVAKREHGKIMAATPKPSTFRRFVDGVEGVREEAARPFGVIQYDYIRLDAAVQFAMETLFDLSPVLSGDYRMAHTLFVDDVAASNLANWRPGSTIVISNFVPYARKIELGKMKMRVSGTDRVYAQAERIVRRRFGNMARIFFTYRGIVGGGVVGGKAGNESSIRYPALVISERS